MFKKIKKYITNNENFSPLGGEIKYRLGGKKLEGGVMIPIPGSDAVEFKGNTHEQGGIKLDKYTEVENNETMGKVTMKKGGNKDYFFSSFLKMGGLSFADHHKNILKEGGSQKDINYLAAMQEKAAKRNPDDIQIARLGGQVKYKKGGEWHSEDKFIIKGGNDFLLLKYENGKWYKKVTYRDEAGKRNPTRYITTDEKNPFKWNEITTPDWTAKLNVKYNDYITGKLPLLKLSRNQTWNKKLQVSRIMTENELNFFNQMIDAGFDYRVPKYAAWSKDGISSIIFSKDGVEGTDAKGGGIVLHKNEVKNIEAGNFDEVYNNLNTRVSGFDDSTPKEDDKKRVKYTSPFKTKHEERAFQDWANAQGYDTKGYGWGKNSQDIYDKHYSTYKAGVDSGEIVIPPAPTGTETQVVDETGVDSGDETATDEIVGGDETTTEVADAEDEVIAMPFTNKEEGNAFRQWVNETYPDYADDIDLDKKGSYNNTYIQKAWDKYGQQYLNKDKKPEEEGLASGLYTDPEGNVFEKGRSGKWRVRWNIATAEGIPEFGEVPINLSTTWDDLQEGFDPEKSGALTKYEGKLPKVEDVEEDAPLTEDQKILYDRLKEKSDRAEAREVPTIAAAAGIAQLGPALYNLLRKQPPAEQAGYTPGFTSPIVAGLARAPKLDRVNYNAERSANAAEMRGINRFIETSGGGPANIINKMMAYSKKQQGDMMIAGAEAKANISIANQEAALKNQVALNNMTRAQQAATTNAQLQAAEMSRFDQINLANAAARQKVKDDEEFQKYQGVATLGANLAGLAGDLMSYKASERMAKMMGSEGIYGREIFRNIASKEIKKSGIPGVCGGNTGIPCTDDMINQFITSQNKETKEA